MTSQTTRPGAGGRLSALPAEPNPFIGRRRDLAELCRLLPQARAVTLCGPGGIGKTRLAIQVARELAGDHPDGVCFVELADVRAGTSGADAVARRVAAVLGLADELGRAPLEALTRALRHRRALVLLDNCEHLVEECAAVCRALLTGCDRLRILATSREPLRVPGENVWRVPPLPVPDAGADALAETERSEAARLFVARAKAARPGFTVTADNAPALAELCRALDGVPLALELAAARVRVLSLEQLADRLTDRFGLLTTGDRTAPPRQRTLRGAIDWSYELLTEPERILLRRLSVFHGWSLEQAEQVCADDLLPRRTILDLLSALVDKSLVTLEREVAGRNRFRMLNSVREYALQRLAEAGEEERLRRRHRDAVLEALEREAEIVLADRPASWRERVALYRAYEVEQHNLRAALAWSRERGDVAEGLRLCLAARVYWGPRGHYTEAAGWSDWFLERGAQAGSRVLGPALVGRAQLAFDQRDFARAESCARAGLEHCRAAGDERMVAAGLVVLASLALFEGDRDRALELSDEAVRLLPAGHGGWEAALALFRKGLTQLWRDRLREAEAALREGIALMRGLDQRWGAAVGQALLGTVARARGDLAAARAHFTEALPALRDIDARPLLVRCLIGLGRCALEQGDLAGARRAFGEGLRLGASIGLRIAVARGLEAFADLLEQEGDVEGAVLLAGAAAALREAIGARPGRGTHACRRREELLERSLRRLGEHRLSWLWGQGRAMAVEDAVAYALHGPSDRGREDACGAAPQGAHGAAEETAAEKKREERRAGSRLHDSGELPAAGPGSGALARPPGLLTPREREIARLIARGLSNRGIADELVISPATVARHVANILAKLGFGSRAQIAVWAVGNLPEGDTRAPAGNGTTGR